MTISEAFNEQPWAQRLGRRGKNFHQMLKHIENIPNALVIETGTAWDKDNFEGQGQSTLIWDWACSLKSDLTVISIDIRQEGIDVAKQQTKHVKYICGDSVSTLNSLSEKGAVSLLYLDSFDWSKEMNFISSFHHMQELATVWAHLPKGCMIAVDDRHGEAKGKHWMVEAYMMQLGYEPVFKNHQIGWIK